MMIYSIILNEYGVAKCNSYPLHFTYNHHKVVGLLDKGWVVSYVDVLAT